MSKTFSILTRLFAGSANLLYPLRPGSPLSGMEAAIGQQAPKRFYELLRAMYLCNGLYDDVARTLYDQAIWREALKPLRNPSYRVVEFYVSKVWPGTLPDALPIVVEDGANEAIVPAIEQVWQWSNWASQKQVFVRWAAIYGDVFVKVATRTRSDRTGQVERVYLQLIDPMHVRDFDTDERGYLTWIRIDIPKTRRVGDRVESYTHTEVWDKAMPLATAEGPRTIGTYRRWEHTRGDERDLEQLGDPVESRLLSEFGIDFVPIVHCQFRDIGEQRGMGAYVHAIDKIDEANRQATRLHQMLFRHNANTWALEGTGALVRDGRSVPPPRIEGLSGSSTEDGGTLTVGDEQFLPLPSGWTLKSVVPQLAWADALAVLNAHMLELEKDLPELAYYRLRDMGELSGRAARLLLSDAIDRALEVRGNCEAALVRLHEMALTIGAVNGLPQFRAVGTFEQGAFAHRIEERDILPADRLEEAQAWQAEALAAEKEQAVTLPHLWRKLGYTEEEIRQMQREQQAQAAVEAERAAEAMALQAEATAAIAEESEAAAEQLA
jgi:hypothetical protein